MPDRATYDFWVVHYSVLGFARSGHSLGKEDGAGALSVTMHHASWQAAAAPAPHGHTYSSVAPAAASLARSAVMYTRSGNSPPPCPIGPRGHRSSPPRPSRRRRRRAAFLRESGSRISHLPSSWPRFTAATGGDPCHSHKNSPRPFAVSHNEESLLHRERGRQESAVGFFSGQLHFLPRVWPVRPRAKQGRDRLSPPLSSLAPSAVCPGPFSMRDIPKALLPGWLLVSLLDTGQLKLGANCSLCWPSGPRRPQFRLICEVTPLENANSATVDRETHTINFLSESGTTKFPIPTLTCRHTQVTNGGFMGK